MIFVVMQPDHPIAIWELPTYGQYIFIYVKSEIPKEKI